MVTEAMHMSAVSVRAAAYVDIGTIPISIRWYGLNGALAAKRAHSPYIPVVVTLK